MCIYTVQLLTNLHWMQYHITGYFRSSNFCWTHDTLSFEGSIFVHFHLLVSWINAQFNFKDLHIFVGVTLFEKFENKTSKNYPLPYCLKLRPVSYKCQVSISGLGIAHYNIINHIAIALHESLASIGIHC